MNARKRPLEERSAANSAKDKKPKRTKPSIHDRYDSESIAWQIPELYIELTSHFGGNHLQQLLALRTQQDDLKQLATRFESLFFDTRSETRIFDSFVCVKVLQLENYLRQ